MKNAYVQFNATREEFKLIDAIAHRLIKLCDSKDYPHDPYQTIIMDLEACHSNGMPLDLAGLLAAPDADFLHDLFGIRRHICRVTGEICDCFVPRLARREVAVS